MQKNISNEVAEAASSGTSNNLHARSASSQRESPQKKGKDKKIWSCHSCRRRKLKCDRFDPCGACQARGEGHSCTWEEGQRPEKPNRESLEQLPTMILNLTEEVKGLKLANSDFMENMRYKEGAVSMGAFSAKLGTTPDIWSDYPCQSLDRKRLTYPGIAALLPESSLLRGLISQFFHASASLTGFIDPYVLVSEVEEVEQIRKGMENSGSPVSLDCFAVKVSFVLASASLAAVNLNAAKGQELGIARINLDAFARNLWEKARFLITDSDSDSFATDVKASVSALPGAPRLLVDSLANHQETASTSTSASISLLKVVSIKIQLLLAARSFAAPPEYLRLHLDTISSAVEASLDSPPDNGLPLEECEWRWQLWSFLCVLDWTSPGIYHNGSYFVRPELHNDPPSKVPGVPDDGTQSPAMKTKYLDRLSQTRYFLEYALALAHLSRRAEDCFIRPGPISPAQATELCSELDALDNKLNFYQFLGSSASGGGRANGSNSSNTSNEHRLSLQEALQVQSVHLSLELGLVRFKLFRREAFHQMRDATIPGPLRLMCMDACMDACILILSQCRNIGMGVPYKVKLGAEGMQSTVTDLASGGCGEERPCPGLFRRVIQPASSAALVGQVLLHAMQSTDGSGLLIPENHANGNGGASCAGRFGREKASILQWHVNTVLTELETLQSTSPLARYKLTLQRQCM